MIDSRAHIAHVTRVPFARRLALARTFEPRTPRARSRATSRRFAPSSRLRLSRVFGLTTARTGRERKGTNDESRPVKPRDTRLDRGSRDRGPARDADINIPFTPFQTTSLRHSHHSSDIRYPELGSHLDRIRIDRASHDAATASTRDVCLRTRLHPRGDAHRDRAPRREREDERERAPQLVPGLGRPRLLGWIHAVVRRVGKQCDFDPRVEIRFPSRPALERMICDSFVAMTTRSSTVDGV